MAKKEKAPATEGEKPEGGEGEAAAPKKGLKGLLSKKMLLIAVPVLLLVLGGGGAGAYFFLLKKDPAKEAKTEEASLTPPTVAFSDLDKLTVNIQGADATPAYLQLSVSLELENDEQKKAMESLMPRIKDQFQAYLRELRLEDLKGSSGVLRLKQELLRRVNVAAAPYHVRDVLLKEMLVQ
ncbi:MAG: flagellar basal body-associated FliL family protein [Alphaproteobacteria bacterium]|nr:flagellar basal body-associated FliL family protein [Alphaproteobacteria bacterium]